MWKISPSRKHPDQLVVIGPYDDAFRSDIKLLIPGPYRRWNDALEAWMVDIRYRSVVESLISGHGGGVNPQPDPPAILSMLGDLGASLDMSSSVAQGLEMGIHEIYPSARLDVLRMHGILESDTRKMLIVAVFALDFDQDPGQE